MMFKRLLISVLVLTLFFSYSHEVIANSDVDSEGVIKLAMEDVINFAVGDHLNVRILETRIKMFDSQLKHTNSQIADLNNYSALPGGNLPTNFEILLEQFPDYDTLTDEEKTEINQLIMTQVLINTSLNSLLNNQAEQQNNVTEQQITEQREQLNNTLRSIKSEKSKNQLEMEKTKEVIKYYMIQKFINLLSLENELEILQSEKVALERSLADNKFLYSFGLVTEIQLEQIDYLILQQLLEINERTAIFNFYIKELKLELGLASNKVIQLVPIKTDFKKLNLSDLENQISKNYDLKKLAEEISLAKTNYDLVPGSNENLKDYFYQKWQAAILEKDLAVKNLKEKLRMFTLEHSNLFREIDKLELEQRYLTIEYNDVKRKYEFGIISKIELEETERKVERARASLTKLKYDYLLLEQKIDFVSKGIIQ